ncbi:MAG: tetratricopeptide repeat protein [Chlorobi bacterium]|nr:tetratricopeptide repeat protein [Chlorobiota bacterium]
MTRLLRQGSLIIFILLAVAYSELKAQDLYSTGVLEYQNKNFKAAAETFEKFIAQNPNEASAYQYLINSYINLKEFDKAIDVIEKNKLRFLNNKDMTILLGKLYMNSRRFDKAEQTLSEVNRKYPEDSEVKMLLARIYFNKGVKLADKEKFNEAIKFLKISLSYDQSFPEAYAMLGSLYLQVNEVEKADKIFSDGLEKFPDNDVIRGNYALVWIKKKNYNKAIKDLEKVWANNKDNVQIGLQLAKLYRVKYKITEAFEIYESLLKKRPKDKAIYNEMLEYYTVINDQENRRKILERMEKVFPKDEKITLNRIHTYVKEGKDSLAIYHYNKYINSHKNEFDVYFILVDLYEKEKDYEKAKELLLKGNSLGLKNEEYYLKLGSLNEKKNDIPAAKNAYREMISRYPSNFLPFLKIGNIFLDEKKLDSAKTYYDLALKVDEKQPFVLSKIAELYAEESNKEKALYYYKKAFIYNMTALNSEQKMMMEQLKNSSDLLSLMDKTDLSREERMKTYKKNIEKANSYLSDNFSPEKYLDEINSLIEDYPTSSILYYYKGLFYEENNDYKTAEKYYLRVLTVSPRDIDTHKKLGGLYKMMNEPDKAIKSFKRVLSLDNKDREAYKTLIKLYRGEGRLSELCDEWLKFHFTQPENKILTEYLIEALHKADRKADAAKIINEGKENG